MKDLPQTEDNDKHSNKIASSIFDSFDLLRDGKDNVRAAGGSKVIASLNGEEVEKNLKYTLRRLVRSLGANVPESRTGYFGTLVTLLQTYDDVSVTQLVELTRKELHANGSSKSEVGDVALGQILVCGAIFRSGMMIKCTEEEQKQVITMLMKASHKKSYLGTAANLILLDFINKLDEEQFSSIVWSSIKQDFKKDIKEHTLDSLNTLLVLSQKYPKKVKLTKLIGISDIICVDTIPAIGDKLMSGIDFNSVGHPIYKEIATYVANSPHLQEFWTTGIDSKLEKHNRNRELVAINILTTILENMKDNFEVIPHLLSKNFFRLFMDWFKGLQTASKFRTKNDIEDDHKIMIKKEKELLSVLAKTLKNEKVDQEVRIEMLKKLLFSPGEINFTEITGTTIVKTIISDLQSSGVKKMAKLFKSILLNTTKKVIKDNVERNWYNNERWKAAELISYLVIHESVKDDTEFKLTYMKLLMCFGFFKIGGDETVTISKDLSGAIKTSFYRCFTSRFSNVDSLVEVLSALSNFITKNLEKEQVKEKLEKQFPKENMDCWELLLEVCKTIETNISKSKVDKVFLILLYQLGLFLFSEPDHVKMARSSIKELKSCYEHYKKSNMKSPKKVTNDEPEWIEVLVEVLLSILSTESSVLRSVVQCVFRLLWEYLTPSSVEQIVSVLDPDIDTNPLTQDDSDDSDKEESENDESDEEEKENDNENGDDEDNASDESDSDMDDDEADETKTEQLKLAIQKALGAAAESDNESIDADMIDEEEGRKLDEALAEAFRQYGHGKLKKTKKERKDKKALSDFRIRVLDLIDIYLEKDPAMDICLGMIAPLTRCLEFCLQDSKFRELENRTRKTIRNLTKIKKFSSTDNVTIEILCDYFRTTVEKGARSHFLYQALGDIITLCATFIINCSQRIAPKHKSPKKSKATTSPLIEILKENLQSFFQNRNCLLPIIFFHNILQLEWEDNYHLVPIIIDNVFNSKVRQFRRKEGLELLGGFYRGLKRIKPSDECLKKVKEIENTFEVTLKRILDPENKELDIKNNFLNTSRKLINTMKVFHESSQVSSSIDFNSLLEVLASCKGLKGVRNEMKTQDVQNGKEKKKPKKNKKKRKHPQLNGHTEPKQKKIKTEV